MQTVDTHSLSFNKNKCDVMSFLFKRFIKRNADTKMRLSVVNNFLYLSKSIPINFLEIYIFS